MEERLIEQVEQMAGVNIDDIDDEEYERLQMQLIESMTAQEEIDIQAAATNEAAARDEDLPEGEAGRHVQAAQMPIANLANQFADWAQLRVAANEEEKKDSDEEGGDKK